MSPRVLPVYILSSYSNWIYDAFRDFSNTYTEKWPTVSWNTRCSWVLYFYLEVCKWGWDWNLKWSKAARAASSRINISKICGLFWGIFSRLQLYYCCFGLQWIYLKLGITIVLRPIVSVWTLLRFDSSWMRGDHRTDKRRDGRQLGGRRWRACTTPVSGFCAQLR